MDDLSILNEHFRQQGSKYYTMDWPTSYEDDTVSYTSKSVTCNTLMDETNQQINNTSINRENRARPMMVSAATMPCLTSDENDARSNGRKRRWWSVKYKTKSSKAPSDQVLSTRNDSQETLPSSETSSSRMQDFMFNLTKKDKGRPMRSRTMDSSTSKKHNFFSLRRLPTFIRTGREKKDHDPATPSLHGMHYATSLRSLPDLGKVERKKKKSETLQDQSHLTEASQHLAIMQAYTVLSHIAVHYGPYDATLARLQQIHHNLKLLRTRTDDTPELETTTRQHIRTSLESSLDLIINSMPYTRQEDISSSSTRPLSSIQMPQFL
jgi:hypothetical protein